MSATVPPIFVTENFDNNHLIISHFTNKGASSMDLLNRDEIYFISLNHHPRVYQMFLENTINLTFHRYFLEYYNYGSDTFVIDNITENTAVLLDHELNYALIPLNKIEEPLTLD